MCVCGGGRLFEAATNMKYFPCLCMYQRESNWCLKFTKLMADHSTAWAIKLE